MNSPRVSVLMPAYNCEPYIHAAITSILEQTHKNIELLICDDGSTDLTWKVANSFSDQRIKLYRHDVNKGYRVTYNYLMSLVEGDYFTFQDADDWSDCKRIELQLAVFESKPNVMVCGCNGSFYYSEKVQYKCPPFNSNYIKLSDRNFEFMLPALMYNRDVLQKFNEFNSYFDRTTGADQYFILEVLSHFTGYAINEYLYTARFNPTSNHRTLTSLRKLAASDVYLELRRQRVDTGTDWLAQGRFDLLSDYEAKLLSNRAFLSEKYREYAVYQIDSARYKSGFTLLFTSLYYSPFNLTSYRTILYALRKAFSKE